ncbi:MAG: flagellar export chaperone FlgN [Geobacteraceae bacterium]|nr:flagellar export chaperone FlgN [Geobacteraceae bacterium]
MSERIEHLKSCLAEKEELLEQLLLVLGEEQSCITGHDVNGIESNRQRKLQLLDHLGAKTSECRMALQSAAEELNITAPPKLSLIIAVLKTPLRDSFVKIQQKILQLGDSVVRNNRRNRDLLYGSLKAVKSSLEFFNGSQAKSCTYCDTGRMASGMTGGRLLHGEI